LNHITIRSTLRDTIASSLQMKQALWSTGDRKSHGVCRRMCQACGNTRAKPIYSNSRKCVNQDASFSLHRLLLITPLSTLFQSKSVPHCITLSPNSSQFVTMSLPDRQVRVFNFLTGKKTRQYDESITAIQEMQQAGTAYVKLEDMEFGRRKALELELERGSIEGEGSTGKGGLLRTSNAVWDESGNFIIYPTLLGIKILNTVTNRVSRMLGSSETSRWLNLALFQGAPAKKGLKTLAMAASANPLLLDKEGRDPTLFATAFKKQRFYIFSRSEPE